MLYPLTPTIIGLNFIGIPIVTLMRLFLIVKTLIYLTSIIGAKAGIGFCRLPLHCLGRNINEW